VTAHRQPAGPRSADGQQERPHGHDRQPGQAPRSGLPVVGDLRRACGRPGTTGRSASS
jgi:hypothetical protein